MAIQKITPFLWFDGNAEEAAKLYTSVFKDSKILSASAMAVQFEIEGVKFIALNGGPHFKFTEAVSFVIDAETQADIDYFTEKLTAGGGTVGQCGWIKDKFGLSWQVVPPSLGKMMSDKDRGHRVMQAMMQMKKLDLAKLTAAFQG